MVTDFEILEPSKPSHRSVYIVCCTIEVESCEPLVPLQAPSPLVPVTLQSVVFVLVQDIFDFVCGDTRLGEATMLASGGGDLMHAPFWQTQPGPLSAQFVIAPEH
jgi:hypothetical protein